MTNGPAPPDPRRAGRRGLASAVLTCAVGAGLALFAVTRTWSTTLEKQPAPLAAKTVHHTGASFLGWLPALALVGLAGAGALLATRGGGRTVVGFLLLLVGLGVLGGGIDGLDIAPGIWPAVVGAGGLAVSWSGLAAMRAGAIWPAMGARYERPAGTPAGQSPFPDRRGTPASMWDDLDQGVDPTDRGQ